MQIRHSIAIVFTLLLLLSMAPFGVNIAERQQRALDSASILALKSYDDSLVAVGIQIRGIQNAFLRATMDQEHASAQAAGSFGIFANRNAQLNAVIDKASQAFLSAQGAVAAQGTTSLDAANFRNVADKANNYRSSIDRVLQHKTLSIATIDQVAPYINAAQASTGKEIAAGDAIIAAINQAEAASAARYRLLYALALGVNLVAIVIAYMAITTRVLRPLKQAAGLLDNIRQGHLGLAVESGRHDEVGQLLGALNEMATQLASMVRTIRDNTAHVNSELSSLHASSGEVLNASQTQAQATGEMAQALATMSTGIADIVQAANDLQSKSDDSLGMTRSGIERLEQLLSEAGTAKHAISEISSSVGDFLDRTGQISNLTQQVREIAEQTNLLALNAAIEAARAGELGRGFAVVADEVRKLAERSDMAARQIDVVTQELDSQSGVVEKSIATGIAAIESSLAQVGSVEDLMAEAAMTVEAANAGVIEIVEAIQRQETGIRAIDSNMHDIRALTDSTRRVVEGSVETARRIEHGAEDLTRAVEVFTL
jgi:methyl-accepting chemotaxis protein